jgi:hypothetical protein
MFLLQEIEIAKALNADRVWLVERVINFAVGATVGVAFIKFVWLKAVSLTLERLEI